MRKKEADSFIENAKQSESVDKYSEAIMYYEKARSKYPEYKDEMPTLDAMLRTAKQREYELSHGGK